MNVSIFEFGLGYFYIITSRESYLALDLDIYINDKCLIQHKYIYNKLQRPIQTNHKNQLTVMCTTCGERRS